MAIIERVKLLESDLPKYVLAGPLSLNTMYSLNVRGPWGSREVHNLIRLLTLQAEWLEEDEKREAAEQLRTVGEHVK